MATLVASPIASPLANSTRCLPDFSEEQSETVSLVDNLLTAWSEQQSRNLNSNQQLHLDELSSYPFPSFSDDAHPASDTPWAGFSHGPDDSDFISDCNRFLLNLDQTAPTFELSHHLAYSDVSATGFYDDSVDWTQLMLPMGQCSQQSPGSLRVTKSEDLSPAKTESTLTPISPSVTSDEMVSILADTRYSKISSSRKRRKVKELQHNSKLQYKDKTGTVVGALIVLGDDRGVRKPYSAADRARTKKTRQMGACTPCRTNKKRCNRPESPYECCDNCKSRVLSMPCFVAKIIDAQLFRDKPSPKHPCSALRHAIFESLTDISQSPQRQRPIIVNLTQDLGLQMLVVLARYDPTPGEISHRVWKKDGQARHIEMPPYCIANMRDAQRHMLEYIANFRSAWLKHVLGSSNGITRNLFDQAQRFAAFSPMSMVSKALDLCAASRIIERDWRICGGPQDLAIPLDSDDETNPFFNFMPITPMMDSQLDQIVIQSFLLPTRHALLASLESKMMSPSNSIYFFEIFLTVSVLLSHAEWLLSHSRQSAVRVGAKTRYNHIPRSEAYFHTCNTLIAYWHHMCRGVSLAEVEWSDEGVKKWAGLDNEQVQFLEDLKKKVNLDETKSMMLRLREENMYESELYWCHQLFFPNWIAGAKMVEDVTTLSE